MGRRTHTKPHESPVVQSVAVAGEGHSPSQFLHARIVEDAAGQILELGGAGSSNHGLVTLIARDLQVDIDPTDRIELMLAQQAVWCHLRHAHLSMLAMRQIDVDALKKICHAADQSAEQFRRHVAALMAYRSARETSRARSAAPSASRAVAAPTQETPQVNPMALPRAPLNPVPEGEDATESNAA